MWGNLLLFIVGDKLHFRLCVMFKSFSYKFEEGETRGAIRNIWCKLEGIYCFVNFAAFQDNCVGVENVAVKFVHIDIPGQRSLIFIGLV